jgi:hypothetical protein
MDQGTPVIPGPCTFDTKLKAYSCVAKSTSYGLADANRKPNPLPPKGIFGNPQHFVMESRDADSETRNFGPVMFNVAGSIDYVSPTMDHVSSRGDCVVVVSPGSARLKRGPRLPRRREAAVGV